MTIERRYIAATDLRAASGRSPRLTGHAAVFNQLSDDLGGYRERIMPGAFAEAVKTSDVRALWNHDANFVLARTKSGTLKLTEDDIGLAIDAELADTQFVRDLLKTIERGDVDQMSFGFSVMPNGQSWRMENGAMTRELRNVDLFDVSPVTFPAYPQTDVAVRAIAEEMRAKFAGGAVSPELEARLKARQDFIASRTSAPNPFSLSEIIKKSRIV